MKHLHHIIPKHMTSGIANNHPDNLISLTVAEHAEAHRKLFEEHGRWQDEVAWKGLAGIIGHEEAIVTTLSNKGKRNPMYGLKGSNHPSYGHKVTDKHRKILIEMMKTSNPMKDKKNREKIRKYALNRSLEHIENLNSRFTEEYKKCTNTKIAREWIIILPDNTIERIRNMSEYCRNNSLHKGEMSKCHGNRFYRKHQALKLPLKELDFQW